MERFPSPEAVKSKEYFEGKLDTILNTPLSVETVNTFADKALHDLINLTREAIAEYQKSHTTEKAGKELEDDAYEALGLTGVSGLLTQVEEKSTQIGAITEYLESATDTKNIITPPDAGKPIQEGSGGFDEKKLLPRLTTLLYIIETDFNIPKEELTIVRGNVSDEMMRNEPYFRVGIEELGKTVYVCDEEGNASYVFDSEKLSEAGVEIEALDVMTKDEKNVLIKKHPGLGVRIIQTKDWRSQVSELLSVEELKLKESKSTSPKSEFVSKLDREELEKYPKVETEGEWKGFWTDPETGKRWGTVKSLAKRFGVQPTVILRWIEDFNLETKIIRAFSNFRDSYSFEDFDRIQEVQKLTNAPHPKTEGEWNGFGVDPSTGKHVGNIERISRRLETTSKTVLAWVERYGIEAQKVRGSGVGYFWEDLIAIPEIQEFRNVHLAATEGEWKGFWTDPETGKHWGSARSIEEKLGVSHSSVIRWAKHFRLQVKKTRTRKICESYSMEDLVAVPEIQVFLNAQPVEVEGEWSGFLIDPETGKHWGAAHSIAMRLGVTQPTVFNWVKKFTPKSRKVRAPIVRDSYILEDLVGIPEIQEFLKNKKD